jgi:ABC-2 type transport system permease protein
MNKIFLIIQREYLTRVKKKSFILMTFLVPLLFIGMWATIAYIAVKGGELGEKKQVKVIDESGFFKGRLENKSGFEFTYPNESFAQAKAALEKSDDDNDYLLHIPADTKNVMLLTRKTTSLNTVPVIEDQLTSIMQSRQLITSGIDTATLARAQEVKIPVKSYQVTEDGEKDASNKAAISTGMGFLFAFMIYLSLFIYGTQVMRGVIEEKTSRIIEVVISSVKPIQLMLGKIIGIGMVGLTQFLLWIILSAALTFVGGNAVMNKMGKEKMEQITGKSTEVSKADAKNITVTGAAPKKAETGFDIGELQLWYRLPIFLFYFLFGYFLYSAIFAAVGSAVDNETETQQFMLPITLPLIFTFVLSINFIIANPHSPLSVWLSIIPFTAPIAMMIRLPFDVPPAQLALSMGMMIVGFLFVTWVAARIYRVGILMYGKKASYKELAKWFFYKE